MGKQKDVEIREALPTGARIGAQTLATVTIAPIPEDQPPVLIAGYDSSDGTLRLANLRTWVEMMAPAEKVHSIGKLDTRDAITAIIPVTSAIGAVVTSELPVPSGEVWYLNQVNLVSPAESGVGVGDIVQVNFRVSRWPDAASELGRAFYPANQGTVALDNFFAEFHAAGPFLGLLNHSEPLRLVGGDIITLVATLTGAIAGANLTATLNPYGWKARYLVD